MPSAVTTSLLICPGLPALLLCCHAARYASALYCYAQLMFMMRAIIDMRSIARSPPAHATPPAASFTEFTMFALICRHATTRSIRRVDAFQPRALHMLLPRCLFASATCFCRRCLISIISFLLIPLILIFHSTLIVVYCRCPAVCCRQLLSSSAIRLRHYLPDATPA